MTTDVTVLGLGNMGSALARAFGRAGHAVAGWNRSARPREGLTLEIVASPAAAVLASPVSVICVSDNGVVREWLTDPAFRAALAGRTVVNLNSSTPDDAVALGEVIIGHGASYLDGFIPLYPEYVGDPDSGILYSGPEHVWEQTRELLSALGGTSVWMGEDVKTPAALFMGVIVSYYHVALGSFVEAAEYARRNGVGLEDVRRAGLEITDIVKLQIGHVVDAMESGDCSTDQAHIDVHWETVAMAAEAMKEISTSRQLHAAPFLADLEHARAAGRGGQSVAAMGPLLDRSFD
ncbi:NAD(P)-binding domain-containing protein [Rhodococcus jostii]|uniref:NAD(P)-binding domain-containing protein n=1 Tax=Rhodococcus jostii TaxID=132919 RepID=UPI003624AE51